MAKTLTLAQLGNILEHGTSRIPARPFLIPAIQTHAEALRHLNAALLVKVLHGEMDKKTALGKLGAYGQGLVQQQIRATTEPPNAPSTIRQKGSSHPLIDSGQMVQNVAWEYEV